MVKVIDEIVDVAIHFLKEFIVMFFLSFSIIFSYILYLHNKYFCWNEVYSVKFKNEVHPTFSNDNVPIKGIKSK